MKKYQFTADEIVLLRDAMSDLAHRLTPQETDKNTSERRIVNYRMAVALKEQFANDLRLM